MGLLTRLPNALRRLVFVFVDGPATPMTLCHVAILDYGYMLENYPCTWLVGDHRNWWNSRFRMLRRMGVNLPDNARLITANNNVIITVFNNGYFPSRP